MKRWLRDVSGAVLASLLTIAFNGKAYADELLAQFFTVPAEIVAPAFQPAAEALPEAGVPVADVSVSVASSPEAPKSRPPQRLLHRLSLLQRLL